MADVEQFPQRDPAFTRAFPIVVVGHVDHGKSTLIGRLLHDTDSLPPERVAQLHAEAARRGRDIEFSFLLDSLQIERDQGITVDSAQIWFHSAARRYVIIDAPGHTEFVRNMITGAAAAEAAVLVVDAALGVAEQTRRHGYLLSLLGLRQVVVAVNKIDLIDHDRERFDRVSEDVVAYLTGIGLSPQAVVPLSARHGDNVVQRGESTPWYEGPTLIEALDRLTPRPGRQDGPLRLPVQDVYLVGDRRYVVGRIESGRLSVGDTLRFAPDGRTARITEIAQWNAETPPQSAGAGESVALAFDRAVFADRGSLATAAEEPAPQGRIATVRMFWLDREPLLPGDRLTLRYGTAEASAAVEAIEATIDIDTLETAPAKILERNGIARVRLRARRALALDRFADQPLTGRGMLLRDHRVVGGFVVETLAGEQRNLTRVPSAVTRIERHRANGHRGGVVWMTGLSGAGKSTLAMRVLRELTDRGRLAQVLDGDDLRHGLNSDLGFGDDDRRENVRRTAEVARLFAEAGMIAIVALISPLASQRAEARRIVGEDFSEVHVKADLAACEARDPKGLYRRARANEVTGFTGVHAPYEPPSAPDLVVDTTLLSLDAAAARLLHHVETAFALPDQGAARAA